jgi:hypothetical protein
MIKKLLIVLIALILTISPVAAVGTCPANWNDPSLSCITTTNWHDFVNNWTYQNSSIWYSLGNVSSGTFNANGLLFQNGTRIMTGSLNAGNYNISNVSNPVVSSDAATRGYVDLAANSLLSIISGWISQNNTATLSIADSHIASNVSTIDSWIQQNNSATLTTADSHIASNMSVVSTWIQQNNSATLSTADSHISSNMSMVSTWIVDNNTATLSTADSHIASNVSMIDSWIVQNNSATLGIADSHIASNLSVVSTWISQNNSATLATSDSHIASNISVPWASFSPTFTWGTQAPLSPTIVSRYVKTGNVVNFAITIQSTDGRGASSLTVTLPVSCNQTANYMRSLTAFKSITTGGNTIMSDPFAYADYTAATPIIKFSQFGTLPSGYSVILDISGSYEVT